MDLSSGSIGELIFYAVFIFFGLVILISGTVMLIIWRRRKLIFTNFLSETGQWERQSWMPDKISDTFIYNNQTYKYDITKCTRDKLNRPIAHYYKGNPEQQEFDFSKGNKKINISTKEITAKDFLVLMTSKVLRDIFQDEEVMNMLWIILIATILVGLTSIIFTVTHNPQVVLKVDNQTTSIIVDAVKLAIINS